MIDFETTLRAHITHCETAWSMGGFGAVAEFHQDDGEPLTVEGVNPIARATTRGGIRLSNPSHDVVPIAYEALSKNPARWAHGVALCLRVDEARMSERTSVTELGPDEEPLHAEDKGAILFDMGLTALGGACKAVDFCVRTKDPALVATLRSACGRSILDPESPAMGAILTAHPHRVALTRLGRIEVYQLIGGPATVGKSPPGPHTHVLPKIMRSGRTHSANQPIPEGLIPCAMMYPGNPVATAMGDERVFDPKLHDAFQALLEHWGRDEQRLVKFTARKMIGNRRPPQSLNEPETRAGRIALRVLCRQLRADSRISVDERTLAAWSSAFDGAPELDPDDVDATALAEGEGH